MTQTLALVVTTSPNVNQSHTAYQLALAAAQKNSLSAVFFYQQGVLNAAKHLRVSSDEFQLIAAWQALHHNYQIPLHLCATAAEKYGLIEPSNETANIASEFTLSGLGELVKLAALSNKLVQL